MFYVGLNWINPGLIPDNMNVLLSAAKMWYDGGWKRRHRFPRNAASKWLDFGGFTFFNGSDREDYPFSVYAQLNLVAWIKPDFFATLDYPCEPAIAGGLAKYSIRQRVERTVQRAVEVHEDLGLLGSSGSQLVPVIQGYEVEDYHYCLDLYEKTGLTDFYPYMAVGSVCQRASTREIADIIPPIWEYAYGKGVERLHWFGLKRLPPDLDYLDQYIWSRDSATIFDSYDEGLRAERGGRRYPRGKEEKGKALASFLARLEPLEESRYLAPPEIVETLTGLDLAGVELDSGTLMAIADEFGHTGSTAHISDLAMMYAKNRSWYSG